MKTIPVLLNFDNEKIIGELVLTKEGVRAVNTLKDDAIFSISFVPGSKNKKFELISLSLIHEKMYSRQ